MRIVLPFINRCRFGVAAVIMLLLVMVLLSQTSWARPFPDFWGNSLPSKGKPLLISTNYIAENLFRDPAMAKPGNGMNFINRIAVDPEHFRLEDMFQTQMIGPIRDEYLSYTRSKLFLDIVKADPVPVDFNGRIVIWGHFNEVDQFATETGLAYNGGNIDLERFGEQLGELLQRIGIQPRQIDLFACCGGIGGSKLMAGLERSGLTNFELRAIDGNVALAENRVTHETYVQFLSRQSSEVSEKVSAADFFAHGKTPGGRRQWIITHRSGDPAAMSTHSCTIL